MTKRFKSFLIMFNHVLFVKIKLATRLVWIFILVTKLYLQSLNLVTISLITIKELKITYNCLLHMYMI